MVRPRNALIEAFPPGTVTLEEASEALRQARGDLEEAKRALASARHPLSLPPHQESGDQSQERSRGAAGSVDSTAGVAGPQKKDSLSENQPQQDITERFPPRSVASINNLSDRQYCCVWSIEVLEDAYRPDVARALLATVARHVNPVLRARGWRVKRLLESCSRSWIGLCTGNGRDDADAASVNIQLNLRVQPHRQCRQFRSFAQVLAVMLHEITHTSIGLEDIHPPAFYELLEEIRQQYYEFLKRGLVDLETDDYGCKDMVVTQQGELKTIEEAAKDTMDSSQLALQVLEEGQCGANKRRRRKRFRGRSITGRYNKGYQSNVPKRRPLLKGTKMVDGRTKAAKQAKVEQEKLCPRELAARAALARLGNGQRDEDNGYNSDEPSCSDEDENNITAHNISQCGCRSCLWDRMLV